MMEKKFTESKVFNIILAVLIAVGLWVYVTSVVNDEGRTTIRNVQVTVIGEDLLNTKGLMIDPGTKLSIQVGLRGSRSALVNIASNSSEYITAKVDVSDISKAGNYDLTCKISLENTVTSGVRLDGDSNVTLRVNVEKLLSKTVEVRGTFTGSVADGYRTNSPEISPGTVQIQGPESVVSQVQYAQVNITGDNLTKTYSGELSFSLMDESGGTVDLNEIKANVDTVNVVLPVVKTLEMPLTVSFTYGGGITESNFEDHVTYEISPSTIQISGDGEDIKPLEGKSITLGTIDLSDVVQTNQTYTFPIVLASELSNDSGISEATVTISVKGLSTKTVETSDIEVINVPSDFSVSLITQSIQIRIRGPEADLESVFGYQFRVVIDLSGQTLSKGQFFFEAKKVYFDGDSSCGVIKSASDSGYGAVVNVQ